MLLSPHRRAHPSPDQSITRAGKRYPRPPDQRDLGWLLLTPLSRTRVCWVREVAHLSCLATGTRRGGDVACTLAELEQGNDVCAGVLPEPAFGGKGTHHHESHTRAHREDVSAGPYLSAHGSSPTAGSGPRYVCMCWCNTLKQTNTALSPLAFTK